MKNQLKTILVISSFLAASCSPTVPKLVPKPNLSNEQVKDDGDRFSSDGLNPKVDILFVVDDSGSMGLHQTNLIQNISKLTSAFASRSDIDFHIGAVSSSMKENPSGTCCGYLRGRPAFVEPNTPDLEFRLGQALRMGTNGDATEMLFAPVIRALTPPVIDSENSGFLRRDAFLAIVFITDAEDQSQISTAEFIDQLNSIKGRKGMVTAYGVIVPSTVSNCPRDSTEAPLLIEEFLGMMPSAGRNIFNLCDPDYGSQIVRLADDLIRFVGKVALLSRPPILSTIHVTYGTQVIPPDVKKGWAFDPSRNALVFGDDLEWSKQPTGTKVKIKYEAASYPSQPRPPQKP